MLAFSTPKPPPKPRRLYQDQLKTFLSNEKLDIIIENQKACFKFMAHVMKGGFVGKHVSNHVNQGSGHVQEKLNVLEGRDRASSVSVGREGGSNVSVGRDRAPSVSEERDRASSVSVRRDFGANISGGRDRP